jgi:hypothetical protein
MRSILEGVVSSGEEAEGRLSAEGVRASAGFCSNSAARATDGTRQRTTLENFILILTFSGLVDRTGVECSVSLATVAPPDLLPMLFQETKSPNGDDRLKRLENRIDSQVEWVNEVVVEIHAWASRAPG